ncbi:MAG: RHS repeat-associated core domain-containing protein [Oscillospiraceae bacterium]
MTDKNGGSPIRYLYSYDTLGRLIGTGQTGGTSELRAAYQYDTNNRLTRMSYSIPGVVDSGVESFYYNGDGSKVVGDRANVGEGTLKAMALFSNSWIYYHYDDLSRLNKREVGGILEEHYTYLAGSEAGTTTTLPETYDTTAKGSSTKLSGYRYAYDERNNIVQETDLNTGKYWKYAYDKLGQLQYATEYAANGTGQKRYKYYYDHAGNLTSWRIEDGTATNTQEEHTYTYGDSNWKDLLTAFDGKAITYDANGNPTKYYNGGTMTWRNGRQLASYSLGGKTYRYEYDVNGLRTRKSNADGGYTEYYIIDGLAVAERRYYSGGGVQYTLRYLYDESNNPVGFGMQYPNSTRWTNYYFEKNVQGDVIGVYQKEGDGNSATHILAARYSYDPYGNPTSMTNGAGTAVSQTSNTIAAINPFRYRGYRYDGDTGLYYLRSRYYDPVSCRFVNADKYVSTGQGQLGHNMFAYCNNNPVRYDDPTGTKLDGLYTYVNDGGSSGSTNGSSENEQARMDSCSISSHDLNRRPNTGEPGSTYYSPNGDTRTYGPDGMPQHDYDHDDHGAPDQHPHDENGGHNHDWKNGVRGPAYSIGWQPIAGVVLVIGCAIGTAIVALDDATGVGVADDFLFGPLGAGIGKGISWIFR